MHSKLAVKLARCISENPEILLDCSCTVPLSEDLIAKIIDDSIKDIREHYKPEELSRCPIVTHHPAGPCAFCITAAMREFILLQE